jgi:hypothetical protein
MDIRAIQEQIRKGQYRFSDHAMKRMIKSTIDRDEVEEVIFKGEILEEYPHDKYAPSCLIYGRTNAGRALHVQTSLPPLVVIITTYEPDPEEWINGKIRR